MVSTFHNPCVVERRQNLYFSSSSCTASTDADLGICPVPSSASDNIEDHHRFVVRLRTRPLEHRLGSARHVSFGRGFSLYAYSDCSDSPLAIMLLR